MFTLLSNKNDFLNYINAIKLRIEKIFSGDDNQFLNGHFNVALNSLYLPKC